MLMYWKPWYSCTFSWCVLTVGTECLNQITRAPGEPKMPGENAVCWDTYPKQPTCKLQLVEMQCVGTHILSNPLANSNWWTSCLAQTHYTVAPAQRSDVWHLWIWWSAEWVFSRRQWASPHHIFIWFWWEIIMWTHQWTQGELSCISFFKGGKSQFCIKNKKEKTSRLENGQWWCYCEGMINRKCSSILLCSFHRVFPCVQPFLCICVHVWTLQITSNMLGRHRNKCQPSDICHCWCKAFP